MTTLRGGTPSSRARSCRRRRAGSKTALVGVRRRNRGRAGSWGPGDEGRAGGQGEDTGRLAMGQEAPKIQRGGTGADRGCEEREVLEALRRRRTAGIRKRLVSRGRFGALEGSESQARLTYLLMILTSASPKFAHLKTWRKANETVSDGETGHSAAARGGGSPSRPSRYSSAWASADP